MGSRNTAPCLPVGFRFRPTDEELVDHYLKHKLQADDFPLHIIPDVDLCKTEPWDIPALSVITSDDPEWYFFSPRDYKYSNSTRFNRATGRGYWKATGRDRKIKARGSNNVIGTKKTLVFYEGRPPRFVKTNWVIHEYHAITFHVNQRNFVLCRLMNKGEKKGDATVCEGEPGILVELEMASDYENLATSESIPHIGNLPDVTLESIFPAPTQAEEYIFPSVVIQQSPAGIEHQASFPIHPFRNAYSRNEGSSMQIPFETTEDEEDENGDEFVNAILAADENVIVSEEATQATHAFVNSSILSEPVRRVYYEGSDTDAEVVSARYGNIPDTSTVCNDHPNSMEYHVSKMAKPSHGSVSGGTRLPISFQGHAEKSEYILRDDFWGVETSSGDSTADKPLEISCIEISSSPSTARRWKNQYHPRPGNILSQRATPRRSQTHRKVSRNAVSHLEAKKEFPIVESEKDQKKAQNSCSRKNLETRSNRSSDVNRKGSFICLETPSSSQSLFPRSVYLANLVIGILLFIVISWEVMSL